MNTNEQVYERMIRRAVDLYARWVTSNRKMRQNESARSHLETLVNNHGDIGMAYVMNALKEEYKNEKGYNDSLSKKLNAYREFIRAYELDVEELEGIKLDGLQKAMDETLTILTKEFKQKEIDCAETCK